MKKINRIYGLWILTGVIALSFCTSTFAFEVTNARTTVPSHSAYLGIPLYFKSSTKYTFMTFKGTLKANLEQMAYPHGWAVSWCAKHFYYVVTENEISGASFIDLASKLVSHYPLKATYDKANKVLVIDDLPPKKASPVK